jgi:hypothetical protein
VFEPSDIVDSSEKFLEAQEAIPIRQRGARLVSTPFVWVTGAVLCAICILIFTITIKLFGSDDDANRITKNVSSTSPPYSKVVNVEPIQSSPAQYDKLEPINSAAEGSPHAIAPDEIHSDTLAEEDQTTEARHVPSRERVKVAAAANIRSGPSASAAIIGIAHVGAEAEIAARDSEWVQIIDPASSKTGWIHSRSLVPATAGTSATSPMPDEGDPAELPQEQADASVGLPDENAMLPTEPNPSVKSNKSPKHGWRHRRGLALRFALRRLW